MSKKHSKAELEKEFHDGRVKWLINKIGGAVIKFDTETDGKKIIELVHGIYNGMATIDAISIDVLKEACKLANMDKFIVERIKEYEEDVDLRSPDQDLYIYKLAAKTMFLMRILHADYYVRWKHVETLQHKCQTCKSCLVCWDPAREMHDFKPCCNRLCVSRTVNRTQQDMDTDKDYWESRPLP